MNYKVDPVEFFKEIKLSKQQEKLTPKSIEFFYKIMEGILLKKSFNQYGEIKTVMGNRALRNFQRYWNKFKLYNPITKEKNNPYSYFYKLIVQAFIEIIQDKQKKEFIYETCYDPIILDSFKNNNSNIISTNVELKPPLQFVNDDIIVDYNELVAMIEQNCDLVKNGKIKEILYEFFNENIVYKLIKNDIILLSLFNEYNLESEI